jgi:hypothetical protein
MCCSASLHESERGSGRRSRYSAVGASRAFRSRGGSTRLAAPARILSIPTGIRALSSARTVVAALGWLLAGTARQATPSPPLWTVSRVSILGVNYDRNELLDDTRKKGFFIFGTYRF